MTSTFQLTLFLHLVCYAISVFAATSVSSYIPVPSLANEPTVPKPPGYRVQVLGSGAYMITDGGYQSLFFVACESVIVVDAPPTIGANVLAAIQSVTPLPVSHMVYSHSHADHIGAAYLLVSPTNATIVAHKYTAELLSLTNDYQHRPYPTVTFDSSYTLQVCNQTLQLDYMGPAHEPGNIFIYAPSQKIVMLVDIVYPGWVPFNDLGEAQNVPAFIKAHDQILTYDFDYYIGGHVDRYGTHEDVLIQREYVQDVYSTSIAALQASGMGSNNGSNPLSSTVIVPPVEVVDPGNFWAVVEVYIDTLAQYVANQTIARWGHRLAGTDVYAFSNAQAMLEAGRIDYGVLGPFGVTN